MTLSTESRIQWTHEILKEANLRNECFSWDKKVKYSDLYERLYYALERVFHGGMVTKEEEKNLKENHNIINLKDYAACMITNEERKEIMTHLLEVIHGYTQPGCLFWNHIDQTKANEIGNAIGASSCDSLFQKEIIDTYYQMIIKIRNLA